MTGERSAVRFAVATIFIDAVGFGIVMPVLPQLVMTLGHVALSEATRIGGWLALTYAAFQFVSGPLIGNLGDRFGRRPVLLGSLAGFSIDYLLMGFAPSLMWLFIGRALAGVFGSAYGPCNAALADVTEPDQRARVFGLLGAAFGIGFIVGPAIGGVLGEFGPRAPFYAAAALAALNFLYGATTFPETLDPENRRSFSWARANPVGALMALRNVPGVLPLSCVMFLWMTAQMVYPSTWAYFAIERFGWSPGMIGASLAWTGILMALIQSLAIGPIVVRFGERHATLIGLSAMIASFTAYMLVDRGWLVFVIMTLGALQAVVGAALGAMMSRRVDASAQGELQGFRGSLMALSAIAAPLMFNPTLAWFTSDAAPFYFPGAAFAIAALFALLAFAALRLTPRLDPVQMPPGKGS